MRIKPTHLKAAAAILQDGDFADATEAAKAVIEEIDRLRAEDRTFMVVRQYVSQADRTPMYMGYGPFPTFNAAQKAAEKGHVGYPGMGVVAVVPVTSYESVQAKLSTLDDLGEHVKGSHWAILREKVGI